MENYKRKYEQAMFRMNKWVEGSEITDPKEVAEFVFPELKESEDERIRKWLLKSMKYISEGSLFFDKVSKDKVIAWLEKPKYTEEDLDKAYKCADEVQYRHGYEDAKKEIEKQGEQKENVTDIISDLENYFATKTKEQQEKDWDEIKNWEEKHFNHDRHIGINPEPKFKVGDWIVTPNNETKQIEKVSFGNYHFTDKTLYNIIDTNNKGHLWTIQDAKDGDVLTTHLSPEGDWIGIYKQSTDNMFETYCFLNAVGEFVINPNRCKNHGTHGLHPATKEQCELLFSKMKEAGYEWDAEKKELKKIEQKSTDKAEPKFKVGDTIVEKDPDEYDYETIKDIKDGRYIFTDGYSMNIDEQEGWQLVKTPANIEQKPTWSEEDERKFTLCVSSVQTRYNDGLLTHNEYKQISLWLKSLRDRMKGE